MMKKVIVTLDINYPKEITKITFPYMKQYASNIGAEFFVITERKYPNLPVTLEKFQMYDIDADYIVYVDADALINPSSIDFSTLDSNTIVVANLLHGDNFVTESLPGKHKIRIHSPFLAFSKQCRYIIEPHDNPLQYTHNIFGENKEFNLDEYIMTLNLLKHGANILILYNNLPKTIAHVGNYSVKQKIQMLKQNVKILENMNKSYSVCT